MATAGSEQPEPKPKSTLRAAILAIILTLCIGGLIVGLQKWDASIHRDPSFSVRLTEVHGLDPARSPVIRPDFNLELHVDNKGVDRTCKEEITVTVFYGDMVVGWADVPDFCVDKRSSVDVNVRLTHTDVLLTDRLRRRLASELQSGELELAVEMRMVIPMESDRECRIGYCTSRQSFRLCRAKPGQDYVVLVIARRGSLSDFAVQSLAKTMYTVIYSKCEESRMHGLLASSLFTSNTNVIP